MRVRITKDTSDLNVPGFMYGDEIDVTYLGEDFDSSDLHRVKTEKRAFMDDVKDIAVPATYGDTMGVEWLFYDDYEEILTKVRRK